MRIINAGVKRREWLAYMKEVYRVLKPGIGWAQCTEFRGHGLHAEGNVPPDSALREVLSVNKGVTCQFDKHFHDVCENMGTYTSGEHLEADLIGAGFVEIEVKRTIIDVGDWRNPGAFVT